MLPFFRQIDHGGFCRYPSSFDALHIALTLTLEVCVRAGFTASISLISILVEVDATAWFPVIAADIIVLIATWVKLYHHLLAGETRFAPTRMDTTSVMLAVGTFSSTYQRLLITKVLCNGW